MTDIKTFKDLEKEVIEPGICSLCGGCITVCAYNKIGAIQIENNIPKFIESDQKICLDCGICYQICPRTFTLSDHLKDFYTSQEPINEYKKLTWAQTTDNEIMKVCQDGGVVTSLLKYLLETKQIDGAIVNFAQSNWESFPLFITLSNELLDVAGTRYSTTPLLEIFQRPKFYSSLPEDEKNSESSSIFSFMNDYSRLAFVGCPCHIQAIKKMKILNIRPANTIKYMIGLFCMENFSYSDLMKNIVEKKLRIKLDEIKKVNIKKNLIITLKDNSNIEIPFEDLEDVVRPNCLYCPDFSNVYTDISVGGIGAPKNNSTVLIHTEQGENLFSNAVFNGYLTEYKNTDIEILKLKENTIRLIQRMTKIKKDRALKNLNKIHSLE